MLQFSFWDILSNLLIATQWTIVLSLIAFLCGGIVGLILLFMRTSRIPPLEWFTKVYIEFFQGTPLLMQLFLFFFGIALFGVGCTLTLKGIPGVAVYSESDMFGFDPGANKYHWYAVTNAGETHDHIADVPTANTSASDT